jgi:hypothetical protein
VIAHDLSQLFNTRVELSFTAALAEDRDGDRRKRRDDGDDDRGSLRGHRVHRPGDWQTIMTTSPGEADQLPVEGAPARQSGQSL